MTQKNEFFQKCKKLCSKKSAKKLCTKKSAKNYAVKKVQKIMQ